ncbi:MAG: GNAT family N-acetyltransferase [Eubacteriaceae bacterium]|nr:GNAT family N-acetyltransferase [Eubacteriaceae bacterium]
MTNISKESLNVISLKKNPEMLSTVTDYIAGIWADENSRKMYEDCLSHCFGEGLPDWYVLVAGEKIIGCAGLITNDFISRMDLYPWICALYIEQDCRGHAYGSLLLEKAKKDAGDMGFSRVYIATDHIGYYEHYGFEYIGMGFHPWGDTSRIYSARL